YGDHRDLHSFPTRRSSDLVQLFQLGQHRLPALPELGAVRVERTLDRVHWFLSFSRLSGMSASRARSHSPRALLCGSNRVDAETPSWSSPRITKFTARRL